MLIGIFVQTGLHQGSVTLGAFCTVLVVENVVCLQHNERERLFVVKPSVLRKRSGTWFLTPSQPRRFYQGETHLIRMQERIMG